MVAYAKVKMASVQAVKFPGNTKFSSKFTEERFQEGLMLLRCFFGLNNILPKEEMVLRQFFKGCTTYFSVSTGFGKSLIFQAIPIIAYVILNQAPGQQSC